MMAGMTVWDVALAVTTYVVETPSVASDEGSNGCGYVLPGRAPGQRMLATVSSIALAVLLVPRQRRPS